MTIINRLSDLTEQQRQLLELVLDNKSADTSRLPIQRRAKNLVDPPLSFSQQSMWFMAKLAPTSPFYNVPSVTRFVGDLNIDALRAAFNALIKRHEVVRTSFPDVEGRPVQRIHPELLLKIPLVDLSATRATAREARMMKLVHEESIRIFDIENGPLLRAVIYRMSGTEHILQYTIHHAIADGWSMGLIARELPVHYAAFKRGAPSPLPDLPVQFADYTLWHHEWLKSPMVKDQLAWWRTQLAGLRDLDLPTDRPLPTVQTFVGARKYVDLPRSVIQPLEELADKHEATLFMALLAGFQLLLSRLCGQDDVAVGTPIANRKRQELENLVGFFANTLVLRTDMSGNPSFIELLAQVKQVTLDAFTHQDAPFEQVVDDLNIKRDASRNPLFRVMFALQKFPLDEIPLADVDMSPISLQVDTTHFDLEVHLWRRDGAITGYFAYSQDIFDSDTVVRLWSQFHTLLDAIVADPDAGIDTYSLLRGQQRAELMAWSRPDGAAPDGAYSPGQRFARVAAANPDATALVYRESGARESGADVCVSYARLQRLGDRVARALRDRGVTTGTAIGLCANPGLPLVAGLLGAMQVGAPPLMLSPPTGATPNSLSSIALDGQPPLLLPLLLIERRFAAGWLSVVPDASLFCLDDVLAGDDRSGASDVPPEPANPTDTAYLHADSGAVRAVSHQLLGRALDTLASQLSFTSENGLLVWGALGRDALVWSLLLPLMRGGRILFGQVTDAPSSASLPATAGVYLHITPAAMADIVRDGSPALAKQLGSLAGTLCSGGLLHRELADSYDRLTSCPLYFVYDPPEAATLVAIHRYRRADASVWIPVGKQLAWPVTVLDRHRLMVPVGIPGVIHVAQAPTPAGEAEPPHPSSRETGDQGRWRADGTLELLIRTERTIRVDGQRVEAGRIEAALHGHRTVRDCHVHITHVGGIPTISAYVASTHDDPVTVLERHVRKLLPERAIPHVWVPVKQIPRTAAGNVDIDALRRLPALDLAVQKRWNETLRAIPAISAVEVMRRPWHPARKRLHISGLLPDWQSAKNREQHTTVVSAKGGYRAQSPSASSFSDGGPLTIPDGAPRTLTAALLRAAEGDSRLTLLHSEGAPQTLSYAQLLTRARRMLTGLRARGLQPGARAILQFERLHDHFAGFWACVLGGVIPVTVAIPPGYDRKNSVVNKLWNIWRLLGEPIVLTNQSLAGALAGVPTLFADDPGQTRTLRVITAEELTSNPAAEEIHASRPDDTLFFQLTSGSTGIPKCIQITHDGVIHHIHGSRQFNGYTPDDVTVNWLPMDHVVPILTCHLKDTYLGIHQVHARTQTVLANPLLWLDLLEKYRATHTWAPNFAFKLINDSLARRRSEPMPGPMPGPMSERTPERTPERTWDLSSMKFFMNAGEQVTLPVIREFMERMTAFGVPMNAMQPSFGMAEVCTCMTYANDFAPATGAHVVLKSSLGDVLQDVDKERDDTAERQSSDTIAFVDLGPPMPGVQIRIADGNNETLPEMVIGRFQIRGRVTTPGYLENPQANREAFLGDWFNSGDLGFVKNGRLTLTGREKEMIIVRGANFYCYEIEDVVNGIDGVVPTFVAACAVDNPQTGTEGLALFFVPVASGLDGGIAGGIDGTLLQTIKETVARDLGIAPTYVIPLDRKDFPKTTSGKIQRTRLKKALEAGQFASLLKDIDLQLENANTVPDWFFERDWRKQRRAVLDQSIDDGPTLLLASDQPLMATIRAHLGPSCVFVEAGTEFARLGDRHYFIRMDQPGHYERLLTSLHADGVVIRRIIHGFTFARPSALASNGSALSALDPGVASLLFLARQLSRRDVALRLLVVSAATQSLDPGEALAIGRAPIRALCRTIHQELASVDCRHVDLAVDTLDADAGTDSAVAARILGELHAAQTGVEVAWRGRTRWVSGLRRARLSVVRQSPLTGRAMYLLSGGLGGIGSRVAEYLLTRHQARLLLVGRSSLTAGQPAIAEKRSTYQKLQKLAGDVHYAAVDICDLAAVRTVVAEAEQKWQCKLAGVFHLAGQFHTSALAEMTENSLEEAVRSKVLGTQVLGQVVADAGLFVGFSSVNGFFGGALAGAYSMASAYLEAYCRDRQSRCPGDTYCLSFSMWNEIGMSRGYPLKEQTRAHGFELIDGGQGIHSIAAALHADKRELFIGLNADRPFVRSYDHSDTYATQQLVAWYTTIGAEPIAASDMPIGAQIDIPDRFGTPTSCQRIYIERMPTDAGGAVDIDALAGLRTQGAVSSERTLPRNSLERIIASAWREVLQIDKVGIHNSFFELGGQSILLVQVLGILEKALNRKLTVVELLRYPTVAALAKHLEKSQPNKKASYDSVRDRAQKQKAKRKARKIPRRRR